MKKIKCAPPGQSSGFGMAFRVIGFNEPAPDAGMNSEAGYSIGRTVTVADLPQTASHQAE